MDNIMKESVKIGQDGGNANEAGRRLQLAELGNSEVRKRIVERYMAAETTLAEERLLAEYYAPHAATLGEEAIAKLLTVSALPRVSEQDALSGAEEYYSPASETLREADKADSREKSLSGISRKMKRNLGWIASAIACAAALVIGIVLWRPAEPENSITPMEIAESLNTLASMNIGDIESMNARPVGDAVVITVEMKNGKSASYLLSRGLEDGELQMLAMAE